MTEPTSPNSSPEDNRESFSLGKGLMAVLKTAASGKIEETKQGVVEAGSDLLDKLVFKIQLVGFYVVAATLILMAATLGVADALHVPTWSTALGLGLATGIAALVWKRRRS